MAVAEVPDITWLKRGQRPPSINWVDGLPEDGPEINVVWELSYFDGPLDGKIIVNDDPLPKVIVYIDSKRNDEWRNRQANLQDRDPSAYIAKLPSRRHLYELVDDDVDRFYAYLGWWSAL